MDQPEGAEGPEYYGYGTALVNRVVLEPRGFSRGMEDGVGVGEGGEHDEHRRRMRGLGSRGATEKLP